MSPTTVTLKLSELKPYPDNAKLHTKEQIAHIAKSIQDFGWQQPIVVDENNEIIIGHGRYEAAKTFSDTEALVPVWRATGLNELQKKALRIADNTINQETGFDKELLRLAIDELNVGGFDCESLGLNDLNIGGGSSAKDDDFIPIQPATTNIKAGDFIKLGRHELICGDSTDIETCKRLLQGRKANLMVTDPPYGVNYDPNWRNGVDAGYGRAVGKVKNDDNARWLQVFKNFSVNIIYCWHAAKFSLEVGSDLKEASFDIISQIIWAKQHFVLSRGDYHWQHEPCWYAVRRGAKHDWQGARDQSTVWEIKNNNSFGNSDKEEVLGHGTQKPIECMARPIRNNSSVHEIIVDPFLGSGTTLIAAEQLERTCLGIEIDPVYCQMIIDRYKAYCEKTNRAFTVEIIPNTDITTNDNIKEAIIN